MPRSFVLIPVLTALVLSGCMTKDTPSDGKLTADATPGIGDTPEKFAAGNQDSGAVKDGWIATFNDELLNKLVTDAMLYNRDLAAAKARVDQAASQARQAGADLLPQIGYAVGASSAGTAANSTKQNQYGAQLNMSWELDVWGRMASGQRAATEAFASTAADFEFARQSLAAQVAKAYFLVIQACEQERISSEFVTIQRRSTDLTQLRREVGRASEFEAAQQRSALATAEDQLQQAQSGRERAARSLELLLGRYPKAETATGAALPAMPPPIPAGLPSQLLERRPDLIAATRRVAAAFNQVESAKAARLPRLSLTASVGGGSSDLRNLNLNDVFWNVAGNMVGPIFDGGRLKEQVVLETAKQQEALALFGKAALTAFQQVETALAEEKRLTDRLQLVEAADRDQTKALGLGQLRYDAGAIDQLSLLTIQASTLNARLAALSVRVARLTNRVDLHLALGGGFEVPPPAPEDALPASKIASPTALKPN